MRTVSVKNEFIRLHSLKQEILVKVCLGLTPLNESDIK